MMNIKLFALLTLSVALIGCQPSDSPDSASNNLDNTADNIVEDLLDESIVAQAIAMDIQHFDISEQPMTIDSAGLTLQGDMLVVNENNKPTHVVIKGSDAGVCLRFDPQKLPTNKLDELSEYLDSSHIKGTVTLANGESIPISLSNAGIIGTMTTNDIMPDNVANFCVGNHDISENHFNQLVESITLSSDKEIHVNRIQWGSSE